MEPSCGVANIERKINRESSVKEHQSKVSDSTLSVLPMSESPNSPLYSTEIETSNGYQETRQALNFSVDNSADNSN
jgi:hypothetical protein